MLLRPATLADVPALARLGRDSFVASFGTLYSETDLNTFLAEVYSDDVVAGEVLGDDCRHMLVEEDGALLGYCKLRYPSKLAADAQARDPLELGQLYTAPDMTGRGIGAALMDWALGEARSGGHDALVLSVYSDNAGAQRFYARYGFAKTADITFRVGQQLDAEYLFELPL